MTQAELGPKCRNDLGRNDQDRRFGKPLEQRFARDISRQIFCHVGKTKNCKMDTGFDDPGIFFSDNFASEEQNNEDQINRQQVKKRFKDFIRQFHEGNFSYRYRCFFFLVRGSEKKTLPVIILSPSPPSPFSSPSFLPPTFSPFLLNTFSPRSRPPCSHSQQGHLYLGNKGKLA